MPRHTRWAAGLAAATLLATSATLVNPAAADASPLAAKGNIVSVWQSRINHDIHIRGYAFDQGAIHKSVTIRIYVDGRYGRTLVAKIPTHYPRTLPGRHTFRLTLHWPRRAKHVSLIVHRFRYPGEFRTVETKWVAKHSPQTRAVVAVAKKYLGSPYSYGAAGPSAFDCSGFAQFVYRTAGVVTLPHNSEAQRQVHGLLYISERQARPGDLVFYMSGTSSYHVSIYAGNGTQYSATDPSTGVVHSRISSTDVEFATLLH